MPTQPQHSTHTALFQEISDILVTKTKTKTKSIQFR